MKTNKWKKLGINIVKLVVVFILAIAVGSGIFYVGITSKMNIDSMVTIGSIGMLIIYAAIFIFSIALIVLIVDFFKREKNKT